MSTVDRSICAFLPGRSNGFGGRDKPTRNNIHITVTMNINMQRPTKVSHYLFKDKCNCIYNAPWRQHCRLIRTDGLPWWSPSQGLATMHCVCSVCVCVRACVTDSNHPRNKVIVYQLSPLTLQVIVNSCTGHFKSLRAINCINLSKLISHMLPKLGCKPSSVPDKCVSHSATVN